MEIRQIHELSDLRRFDIAPGFAAVTRSAGLRSMFEGILPLGAVITVALRGSLLVGYAADLPFVPVQLPDRELRRRWSFVPDAHELGAIEVARPFRGERIAQRLLEEMLRGGRLEQRIVIAEGLHWHWDTAGRGLPVAECRRALLALFAGAGFRRYDTDEPEVSYSMSNFLIARVGALVPESSRRAFEEALCAR